MWLRFWLLYTLYIFLISPHLALHGWGSNKFWVHINAFLPSHQKCMPWIISKSIRNHSAHMNLKALRYMKSHHKRKKLQIMANKNVLLFVYKEFLQNSKENPNRLIEKWVWAMNRQPTKEEIQVAMMSGMLGSKLSHTLSICRNAGTGRKAVKLMSLTKWCCIQ